MTIDPTNPIVQLCAEGMNLEGEGKSTEAAETFMRAWDMATSHYEQFIAAHYVARHQHSVTAKLQWDLQALEAASKVGNEEITGAYPSLYLNIAKCYEDLGEYETARQNYETALSFNASLSEDGNGKMIKSGILAGLARIADEKKRQI
ncbi:MAG: tetratricopeptide repeat protein [Imperialibacter sp.]|uniref:tetratricopeptide repeat protein n=1 Tax=Imperialibacter sp. TaxID=2038411 RepID=UPI0032EFCDCC